MTRRARIVGSFSPFGRTLVFVLRVALFERTVRAALCQSASRIRCAAMSEQTDHYFTAEPASAAERAHPGRHPGRAPGAACRRPRGVFCPDRLDVGTAVLLAHVPDAPGHRRAARPRLRLGADRADPRPALPAAPRCGPSTSTSARWTSPAHNAAALGLADVHACTPEEVPADADASRRSGPTRRSGWARRCCTTCCSTWLPRLAGGGAAYLVVQKNLGSDSLQRWLDAELAGRFPGQFSVARHASARTFRVLSVTASGARPSLSHRRGVPARRPPGRGAGRSCGSR